MTFVKRRRRDNRPVTADDLNISGQVARVARAISGGKEVNMRALAEAAGVHPLTVYKWMYPVSKGGTGGRIPLGSLDRILAWCDLNGIHLTSQMLDPR